MEAEKFTKAKELTESIEKLDRKLRMCETLLGTCGLSCNIQGTKAGFARVKVEYTSYSKDLIKKLLEHDIESISKEKDLLVKEFNEL